jgi:hypothetical protein
MDDKSIVATRLASGSASDMTDGTGWLVEHAMASQCADVAQHAFR